MNESKSFFYQGKEYVVHSIDGEDRERLMVLGAEWPQHPFNGPYLCLEQVNIILDILIIGLRLEDPEEIIKFLDWDTESTTRLLNLIYEQIGGKPQAAFN